MEKYYSPADFNATYTSSSTITLSSLPFTINNSSQILYVKVIKADNTSFIYANGVDSTITISSNIITIYQNGTPISSLLSSDNYEVVIANQTKAYDPSVNSLLVNVLNPEYNHYTSIEHLVSSTNLAAGTYNVSFDMNGYKNVALHLKGNGGVTFKLMTTLNEEDSVGVDVSTNLLGVASQVDSEAVYFIENKMPDKFIVQYTTDDGTNVIDIWIRRY